EESGKLAGKEVASAIRAVQVNERIVLREMEDALHKAATISKWRSAGKLGGKALGILGAGAVFALSYDSKGAFAATADAVVGSLPVVGWIQAGVEMAAGEDFFTKDGLNFSVFPKAAVNIVCDTWDFFSAPFFSSETPLPSPFERNGEASVSWGSQYR